MLEVLMKLAGKIAAASRPATAAELRSALAELDEAPLVAAMKAADCGYREALLSADEKRLSKAETALGHARRDLDRCRAAVETLTAKAIEAEAAEVAAVLAAERAEIEREADAVAAELRKVYPAAARQIVSVLEKLATANGKVEAFNQRAVAGDGRTICPVEGRAFPLPTTIYAPTLSVLRTSLQPCGGQEGWGEARLRSDMNGVGPNG